MKEIQYKDFSLRTHSKNWRVNKPNVCQFELTFGCDFHCLYCYSDCYNNPNQIKNELSTNQIKKVLDKVYDAGCLWLCFTGGDPLKREDFLEIYAYAKKKGFIVTVFTNGYSLTKKIADFFKKIPPFVVEITLNSVTKKTFEEISQLPGSFEKTFENIDRLIKRGIPLKLKTEVIKNNLKEVPGIEKFVNSLGLKFKPSVFVNARLNKDTKPCSLRIAPGEFFGLGGESRLDYGNNEDNLCRYRQGHTNGDKRHKNYLFQCAAGSSDSIFVDPYGRIIFCHGLRKPLLDLRKYDIRGNISKFTLKMRKSKFITDSLCSNCKIRNRCFSCPGYAFLEKGNMELPIDWFCHFAHLASSRLAR